MHAAESISVLVWQVAQRSVLMTQGTERMSGLSVTGCTEKCVEDAGHGEIEWLKCDRLYREVC